MKLNILFSSIQVDGIDIVNGHHRYLASLLTGYDLDRAPGTKSPVKKSFEWKDVKFVGEDGDTPAKILELKEEDARYNGMILAELLKKNEIISSYRLKNRLVVTSPDPGLTPELLQSSRVG